jgi:crotonobetainyl-CoA:carnitine CoA-transferase CaiB-like acyl-CoA transferase
MAALQALAAVRGVREGVTTGVHIDVSEQEVLSTGWSREIGRYTHTGEGLARSGRRTGVQGYPHTEMASDGYVFLFAQGKSWEGVAAILGLYEFLTDEWLDPATRVERWDEIEPAFQETVGSRSRYEWFALAAEQGFTFAPVEDARSILDSPQLAARGFWERVEVDGREMVVPALPFTFAGNAHPRGSDGPRAG